MTLLQMHVGTVHNTGVGHTGDVGEPEKFPRLSVGLEKWEDFKSSWTGCRCHAGGIFRYNSKLLTSLS